MEAAYKIEKANTDCAFYTIERVLSPADHDRHAKSVISGPFDDSKIHSEYALLWEEVRRAWDILNSAPGDAKPTGDPRAQISPLIGNTMRRIIESYLIHLCGIGSITELGESSDAATRALMAFTNNNSHDAFDMDLHAVHNLTIDQLFHAFEQIFTEHGAADHYNMMMRKGATIGIDA